ncbi:MAG: hypothetical protein AB7C89_03775, partial [Intestinibacillus sp.]
MQKRWSYEEIRWDDCGGRGLGALPPLFACLPVAVWLCFTAVMMAPYPAVRNLEALCIKRRSCCLHIVGMGIISPAFFNDCHFADTSFVSTHIMHEREEVSKIMDIFLVSGEIILMNLDGTVKKYE